MSAGERPLLLVIRDPDYENEYISDDDIEIMTIDLGSAFNGPKDFDAKSEWGQEWLLRRRAMVAHLDKNSTVRRAVEELCNDLEARS